MKLVFVHRWRVIRPETERRKMRESVRSRWEWIAAPRSLALKAVEQIAYLVSPRQNEGAQQQRIPGRIDDVDEDFNAVHRILGFLENVGSRPIVIRIQTPRVRCIDGLQWSAPICRHPSIADDREIGT